MATLEARICPGCQFNISIYALWQRQQPGLEQDAAQLDYWKRQLGDKLPILELPADRPRPPLPSNQGRTRMRILSAELSASLSQLAYQGGEHRQQATKFMTMLAAFKTLLHRYSGQDDIVVGSPISRRTQQETEHLIGLFLNLSVLRTNLSGDPTFRELLERIRQTALQAYVHQNVPFEKVVEALQPARDLSRTPLFQVMFTFQDTPARSRILAGGLIAEVFELDLEVAPFDLTLLLQEHDSRLVATMEYKSDLFSDQTIERMLGHFETLLAGIVQNPEARLSELPLLSESERRQLLVQFNPAPADYPRDKCLHQLFEEQAARTPKAVAVKFGAHSLTYREMNERANQLARYLQTNGAAIDTFVGICLERSPEMLIAVLAAMKAGAAYVPFEPDEPHERLAFKLRDSGVKILVTQHTLESRDTSPLFRARAHGAAVQTICLDRDRAAISAQGRENPGRRAQPNNLIYMIYTSGSTGVPKGILVEHRSVVNHCVGSIRHFGLGSSDRVLQFAPLSFDVSGEEIFPTLLSGGTLVLRPPGLAVSVKDFHSFVVNEKLTALNLPTPYWSQWMDVIEQDKLELPRSVRLVIVGSDTVSREQLARWQRLAPAGVRWSNAYGTTEATITALVYEPAPAETPYSVPIGRPTLNTQVYILDRHRNPVPIGVPGEIHIGGEQVARGYLNRPDATAAHFVPDVFSQRPGARLNRTGDFGRWRADGNVEFLGRRDNQVKIRGFRIELGEVESALLRHPLVREAAVVPREDAAGEKRLVAYFVANDDSPQLVGKLLHFLKERLPPYMIPAMLVPLSAMPRLSSGKLDPHALPEPGATRPDLVEDFVPPSDSLEEKLAQVWRQVLGLENVGVNDNFFYLGGHSLLALRLFEEIERITGWSLPVLTLFQSPTIKHLAEIIRHRQSSESRSSILPVQPSGSKPPLFLIHGAAGGMLWGYANLARHLGDDQPVYAFNSQSRDGSEEFATIEEMAAQYVKELRTFQPQGPYYLGGYCFGGEVAFEMAQQLAATGQRVALLALFNAMPPNSSSEKISLTPLWIARFARNSWHWFRYYCQWTPDQRRTFTERKLRALKKRLGRLWSRNAAPKVAAEDQVDLALYSEDQRRLWDVHLRASATYHPRPYPGNVTVFRTRTHPFFSSFDPSFGWSEFARGGVTVKIIPGAHESILDEPQVRVAAAELNHCLELAQREGARHEDVPSSRATEIKMLLSSVLWVLEMPPAV